MYNMLKSIFQDRNRPKLDDLEFRSAAFVPLLRKSQLHVMHVEETKTRLIEDSLLHSNNLRILGKVISALESPRLYALPQDEGVESLIRSQLLRFDVAEEVAHFHTFERKSDQLKPPPPTPSLEPLTPPPSPTKSSNSITKSQLSVHFALDVKR
ncbi:hypothetical protein BDP27DRAFT_489708 [Rhodocollybia butyracea]|uniref:Uncharacterized protein n=1 Tax=Rhodocollybia butyracea TaxID=206335 RepID=A0A9P5QAM0_9AGAR|nr:hypothetical protein BDP27DRAFT_489708 [Rhodocollybia butyracea]